MLLKFPPHVRGPRTNCLYCSALIGDYLPLEEPSKVQTICDHSGESYHALTKLRERRDTKIRYVCKELACEALRNQTLLCEPHQQDDSPIESSGHRTPTACCWQGKAYLAR